MAEVPGSLLTDVGNCLFSLNYGYFEKAPYVIAESTYDCSKKYQGVKKFTLVARIQIVALSKGQQMMNLQCSEGVPHQQ